MINNLLLIVLWIWFCFMFFIGGNIYTFTTPRFSTLISVGDPFSSPLMAAGAFLFPFCTFHL